MSGCLDPDNLRNFTCYKFDIILEGCRSGVAGNFSGDLRMLLQQPATTDLPNAGNSLS